MIVEFDFAIGEEVTFKDSSMAGKVGFVTGMSVDVNGKQ